MKVGYFKAKDLKKFLEDIDDETEIFIENSINPLGNISELAEVKEDLYGFFGSKIPCIILKSAEIVDFDDE